MINHIRKFFTPFVFCISILLSAKLGSQNMYNEFKAMPAFPAGAKEAFAASKTGITDSNYYYIEKSKALNDYLQKLQNETRPYQAIIEAKGKAGMAPGMGAANDFSDLNSPETQARIAKMSQEEKMKFAMEVRERMNTNKNIKAVNEIAKPSPLAQLMVKLANSSQSLFASMVEFPVAVPVNRDKCNFNCNEYTDPTCGARIAKCDKQVSHDYHTAEIARYNVFIKNAAAHYALKKAEFEKDLKEFDMQVVKYPKNDVAGDYINAISLVMGVASRIADYEKNGATVMILAKNDPFVKKEF